MPADICVIVPTIRHYGCLRDYFANARDHGFDLTRLHLVLVTEDFCDVPAMEAMLREEGVSGEVFDQRRRDAWFAGRGLGRFADLIPRRSHAETSFGLLVMLADARFKYGVFIDDDTLPEPGHDFFGGHLRNLEVPQEAAVLASDRKWVNVLHENFGRHGLYPRGYPYSAMKETLARAAGRTRHVVCSQGLWTNVPDLDAVRILMDGNLDGQAETRTTLQDFQENFLVAPGNYLTICSMNLAFRREIIPVFYQLPMDDNPWKIGRFDDIWSGVFLKRAADRMGHHIITGAPLCIHNKAPRSTFKDLNAEVPALEINEHLWAIVDGCATTAASYRELTLAMADAIAKVPANKYAYGEFLAYMAEKIRRWIACCDAVADGA